MLPNNFIILHLSKWELIISRQMGAKISVNTEICQIIKLKVVQWSSVTPFSTGKPRQVCSQLPDQHTCLSKQWHIDVFKTISVVVIGLSNDVQTVFCTRQWTHYLLLHNWTFEVGRNVRLHDFGPEYNIFIFSLRTVFAVGGLCLSAAASGPVGFWFQLNKFSLE